jgi:hypothetical protein
MARRAITVNGTRWEVSPSGRITVYGRDEFGLVFETGDGTDRVRRVTRYSPLGARRWEASLHELSDAGLEQLFHTSQPAWTSPETHYRRVS